MNQPVYNLWTNLKFHMSNAWKWNKKLVYFQILAIPPGVLSGYFAALIPAELVRALENKFPLPDLLMTVISLVVILNLVLSRAGRAIMAIRD